MKVKNGLRRTDANWGEEEDWVRAAGRSKWVLLGVVVVAAAVVEGMYPSCRVSLRLPPRGQLRASCLPMKSDRLSGCWSQNQIHLVEVGAGFDAR